MLYARRRRSVAEQDNSPRRDAAETSLRHDGNDGPAKSAACFEPLRLETAIAPKLCGASWPPILRAAMGMKTKLGLGRGFDRPLPRRTGPLGPNQSADMIEVMAVVHITEAEAARDFPGIVARVSAGEEIVIDRGFGSSVAMCAVFEPSVRTLSDFLRWSDEHKHLVDDDFARDMEEIVRSRHVPPGAVLDGMIARHWRGWTKAEHADAYERLLQEKVLPELSKIEGYKGGIILRSEEQGEVEFVVVNLFESLEAVQRFAGPDYSIPVFESEARRLLCKVEPVARHYEVRASTVRAAL